MRVSITALVLFTVHCMTSQLCLVWLTVAPGCDDLLLLTYFGAAKS